MADPRFFERAGPFTLAELTTIAGAKLAEGADPGKRVVDVAPLESAGPDELSFLDNRRYVDAFAKSGAGACLVDPKLADRAPSGMALLLSPAPYHAYARIAQAFYPDPKPIAGVAAGAVVDPSAKIGEGAMIESGAVIGPAAEIGARCRIGANAVIGAGVVIGEDCRIGATATLSHCRIGARAILHPGVRIGQDGFGFAMSPKGHIKVPQLGRVIVGDDVEIGANSTIDRGAGPDTVIGDGAKIDNLVQIAHNVRIGKGCIIVAQVGISGSTQVDDLAAFGGQAGITGHLRIGKGAQIAAQSGVMRDVAPGETVGGSPAVPMRAWLKQVALLARLAERKDANKG